MAQSWVFVFGRELVRLGVKHPVLSESHRSIRQDTAPCNVEFDGL